MGIFRSIRFSVVVVLLFLAPLSSAAGFPATEWEELLGGSGDEFSQQIDDTYFSDGFILTGVSYSDNSGNVTLTNHGQRDIWVVTLNTTGAIQWQRLLGGSDQDTGASLDRANFNGYLLAADTLSSASGDIINTSHGNTDVWIVHMDPSGNILQQKLLGGSGTDSNVGFRQTDDLGFLLVGATNSNGTGD
ncbi:MAG TPA: hypothetical protein PLO06_10690, partial [Methanoregulaceae archaeon]|nr:hypothetical protein [Methanoregulaceae archaeon]